MTSATHTADLTCTGKNGRGNPVGIGLLLGLCLGWASSAAAETAQTSISIKLTVLAPPACEVTSSGGGQVEVDFGNNIGINKIDGVNYRQPMNYRIKCATGSVKGLALKLTMKGTAADFDSTKAALKTNIEGLGIRLYHDGSPLVLNEALTIDKDAPPKLEAVPVKKAGAILQEGEFAATATLLAEYE